MSDLKLTRSQRDLLSKAKRGWAALPAGVSCTNMTLNALIRRGLVKRRVASPYTSSNWQWRLATLKDLPTPPAAGKGEPVD